MTFACLLVPTAVLAASSAGATSGDSATIPNDCVDIRAFGAKTDPAADNTAAIQRAINSGAMVIHVPDGAFRHTGTLVLSNHLQTLRGNGARASSLFYDPSASGSALQLKRSGGELFQVTIKGLGLRCASNSVQKTAIECYDIRSCLIDDVEIYPWTGSTTNNIGIWTRGRDLTRISRPVINADIPLRISPNPNNSISIDHWDFQDCEFISCSTNACILIDPGVNLSEVTFGGFQTWSMGAYGLYWSDRSAHYISHGLHITGLRREQQKSTNGYSIYIDKSRGSVRQLSSGHPLLNFTLENSFLDTFQNGVLLRGVQGATFSNVSFSQTNLVQLDADVTCQRILLLNCFSQQGGTARMAGLTNVVSFPTGLSASLPETGLWLSGAHAANSPTTLASLRVNGTVGVGTHNAFNITADGNIGSVRGVPLKWPLRNVAGVLANDGLGNLSWSSRPPAVGAGETDLVEAPDYAESLWNVTSRTNGFGKRNNASLYAAVTANGTNVQVFLPRPGTYQVEAQISLYAPSPHQDWFKFRDDTSATDVSSDFAVGVSPGNNSATISRYVTTASSNHTVSLWGRSDDSTYGSHYLAGPIQIRYLRIN